MKKFLIALILILLIAGGFGIYSVNARANWCPEYLTDGECVTDQIVRVNLPDPVFWSTEDPSLSGETKAEFILIATTAQWEYAYPSTTPPAGFPEEKWYVVGRIYIPSQMWFLGARLDAGISYRLVPFVFFDQRVVGGNNYFSSVYVGYGVQETRTGGETLPLTKVVKWEIPANTIGGIPGPIVPKAEIFGEIVNLDPENPVPWAR